jgi:hypothetical protein
MIMAIEVKENEDGSFDISWDEKHPTESMFNTWTAEDFTKAISDYLDKLKENQQGEQQ